MGKKIFLFILGILLFSCVDKKQSLPNTKLPNAKEISSLKNTIMIDDKCYSDFFVFDSLLILIANCDSTLFHVYNKSNFNLIKKFGYKGAAPHEFMRPIMYNTNYLDTSGIFNFYDIHQLYNKKVDFNKILLNYNIADCIESVPIDENLMFCHEINFINDTITVMRSVDKPEGLFMFYNKLTKNKKKFVNYYPKLKINEKYLNSSYYGLINSNPQKKIIMYASKYMDEILFFNLKGELIQQYFFSEIKSPALSTQFIGISNDAPIYSLRVYNTKKYSYVLRTNQSINTLLKSKKFPSQIFVFDWEGILIDIYNLPFLPYLFCVDDKTNVLYVININDDENNPSAEILTYQM